MIQKKLRTVIVTEYGYAIKRRKRLIVIFNLDGEQMLISPFEIDQIVISGNCSITSSAITLLLEHDVDVLFLPSHPEIAARLMPVTGNTFIQLWMKQQSITEEKRMAFACEIMRCAIYNKIRMLQQLMKNIPVSFSADIHQLKVLQKTIDTVDSTNQLLGIEGNATRLYFSCIRQIIPKEFGFFTRKKHPSLDPVNAMLSYGYTILLSKVTQALLVSGLNIYQGFLHKHYRKHTALSFDIMELFRQPVVDRVVITLINQKRVGVTDFQMSSDKCIMKKPLKKIFVDALYTRFEQVYKYRGELVELQDIIQLQAIQLRTVIRDDSLSFTGFRYQ